MVLWVLATPLYEQLAKEGVGYIAIRTVMPVNMASPTPKFCSNRQIPGFCGDTIAPMRAVPYDGTRSVAEKVKKQFLSRRLRRQSTFPVIMWSWLLVPRRTPLMLRVSMYRSITQATAPANAQQILPAQSVSHTIQQIAFDIGLENEVGESRELSGLCFFGTSKAEAKKGMDSIIQGTKTKKLNFFKFVKDG